MINCNLSDWENFEEGLLFFTLILASTENAILQLYSDGI